MGMKRLTQRLNSPAMVVAIVALVAALAGGAYAAKKISTKQIRKGAVTTNKLAKNERSQGFVYRRNDTIALPAGTPTEVAILALPQGGQFIVTAHVTVSADAATPEFVECSILDNGATNSRATTTLPDAGGTFNGSLALTGATGGGTVTVSCEADSDSTSSEQALTAIRVGAVFAQ
jgi:hypothetical protein